MLTRRSFLSALCVLPFVGKFFQQPEPWTVDIEIGPSYESEAFFLTESVTLDEYKAMFGPERPGHHMAMSCPFGKPLGRPVDCICKHHNLTRHYYNGRIGEQKLSVSDWITPRS